MGVDHGCIQIFVAEDFFERANINAVLIHQGSSCMTKFMYGAVLLTQTYAEIVSYNDLMDCGTYTAAKDKGLVRLEGKEYVVQDGDIILFRFNV